MCQEQDHLISVNSCQRRPITFVVSIAVMNGSQTLSGDAHAATPPILTLLHLLNGYLRRNVSDLI